MYNRVNRTQLNLADIKAHAEILRPSKVRFNAILFEPPTGAYFIIDPPYFGTATGAYKSGNATGIYNAVNRLCKTRRVMLFCGRHETENYKSMIRGEYKFDSHYFCNVGNAAGQRVEVCFNQWGI